MAKPKSWNTNTNKWEIQNLKCKEKAIEDAEYGLEKDVIWSREFGTKIKSDAGLRIWNMKRGKRWKIRSILTI
jgi:hypothetical protein